jgi:hypothetical protein
MNQSNSLIMAVLSLQDRVIELEEKVKELTGKEEYKLSLPEAEIKEISYPIVDAIIDRREPLGLFWYKDGDCYVGIDNNTGDAWTEEFTNLEDCMKWLKGQSEELVNKRARMEKSFQMTYCRLPYNFTEYKKAYRLWIKHDFECEMFNREVCTGKYDREGFSTPDSDNQRSSIMRNASQSFKQIEAEKRKHKISDSTWRDAKNAVGKLTWVGLQKEYDRIFRERNMYK